MPAGRQANWRREQHVEGLAGVRPSTRFRRRYERPNGASSWVRWRAAPAMSGGKYVDGRFSTPGMFDRAESPTPWLNSCCACGDSAKLKNSSAAFGCLDAVETAMCISTPVVGLGTTKPSGAPAFWSATRAVAEVGKFSHFSPAATCWAPGFELETKLGDCVFSLVRKPAGSLSCQSLYVAIHAGTSVGSVMRM